MEDYSYGTLVGLMVTFLMICILTRLSLLEIYSLLERCLILKHFQRHLIFKLERHEPNFVVVMDHLQHHNVS